jgi:hypothetical protein
MLEPYKGYFIDGSALMTHPFNPDCMFVAAFMSPAPVLQS